jgi:ribosomal protein L11 methylase PrmA
MTSSRDPGSFRDPTGFVFFRDGVAYRQVNAAFAGAYRAFVDSGLYDELVKNRLLVRHDEIDLRLPDASPAHVVLQPEQIPFISYPYEWCFSQLKAAALLTLQIQRRALGRGQVLRDASAYNVQFLGTRPVFIDTLSFGPYIEGQPWTAYRQFCQHFLAPLALMSSVDPMLGELARSHIDGVPLALAASLLPLRTRLSPGLLMHVHLHARTEARAQRSVASNGAPDRETSRASALGPRDRVMTRTAMLGLIDSLERTVDKLTWSPPETLWSTYGTHLNYTESAQEQKRQLVGRLLDRVADGERIGMVWDLGANTGDYSRLAAGRGARVISFDADRAVVEQHFRQASGRDDALVLPLVQNFANPSPALGWAHAERRSLVDRGPANVAMALALVHHLAIGCNVPLPRVAAFFASLCRHLIVEFVPKEDSQVRRMLRNREDVFGEYSQPAFEAAFGERFTVRESARIEGTVRTLYLMERR